MKKRTSMTAAEAFAMLQNDPKYQARHQAKEQMLAEKEARARAEQKQLSEDLTTVGIHVTSAWDLLPVESYPEAVPILIEHLQKPYSDGVLGGIARALTVREAVPYWDILVKEYLKTENMPRPLGEAKDGLAVAIGGITNYNDEAMMKVVIDLLKDKRHGESRVLMLRLLRKSNLPIVKVTLQVLMKDTDLSKEILSWKENSQRSVG